MSTEPEVKMADLSPVEYQKLRNEGKTLAANLSAEGEQDAPKTEVPREASEAQETEPETLSAPEPDDLEDEEAEKPKGKGGFQRRIDKLTSKLRLTEQERDELREAQKQKAAEEPKAQPTSDKPLRENFASEDEWIDAYADWRDARKEAQERQQAEQERLRTVFTNFNKQVTAAREAHDDFDEVVGSPVEIPKSVEMAIPHLENGASVAYHLGKNPEIARKLMDMDPLQAVAEVGKISEKLLSASSNGRPPDKKPASKAAAPITPIETGSSRTSVPLADLPPAEYIKRRNAQDEKRRAG